MCEWGIFQHAIQTLKNMYTYESCLCVTDASASELINRDSDGAYLTHLQTTEDTGTRHIDWIRLNYIT